LGASAPELMRSDRSRARTDRDVHRTGVRHREGSLAGGVRSAGRASGTISTAGQRPGRLGRLNAESGQPSQVRRGGEQPEIGIDLDAATDSRSSSTVTSAHEVHQLALDLGPPGAVVSDPFRVALAVAYAGESLFVGADTDSATLLAVVQLSPIVHSQHASPKMAVPPAVAPLRIPTRTPVGQVTVSSSRSTSKRSFPNSLPGAVGHWVLHFESMPASSRHDWKSPVP
jgi:hypothetical protein